MCRLVNDRNAMTPYIAETADPSTSLRFGRDDKRDWLEIERLDACAYHANCSKNRKSPEYSWPMSLIPYFIMAMRSTPMPKAKPLIFFGS
jgi:hypothetical protein